MAEMDLNHAKNVQKSVGGCRIHLDQGGWRALPGSGVVRAEVRGRIWTFPPPGVPALGPGEIPALPAKPQLTLAGLNLDLQGHHH